MVSHIFKQQKIFTFDNIAAILKQLTLLYKSNFSFFTYFEKIIFSSCECN